MWVGPQWRHRSNGCLALFVRIKNVDLDRNTFVDYARVNMWILERVRRLLACQLGGARWSSSAGL